MADWDANSPKLQRNLQALGPQVTADARARQPLTSEAIRQWHAHVMRELTAPQGEPIGTFRGERGLADYDVRVGGYLGVSAREVAGALHAFDKVLQQQIGHLDALISPKRLTEDITNDRLNAILILCAWAHGEWVRIHPFPNGNGRSARILVNSIAQRYGLPAFMRVRPRPGDKYEWIAQQAMQGNWKAAIPFFARRYEAAL